jgi:hypothetical protein
MIKVHIDDQRGDVFIGLRVELTEQEICVGQGRTVPEALADAAHALRNVLTTIEAIDTLDADGRPVLRRA